MSVAAEIKTLDLTPPQTEIFMCKSRFRCVNAGRRFGKTFLAKAECVNVVVNKDKKKVVYIAPTAEMARDLMWNELVDFFPEEYIKRKNEQLMYMKLINGSEIHCLSGDKPDRLVGKKADLLIVDECALIDNSDGFFEKLRPILSDKYVEGRALFISTPRGFNWFYDLYCNEQDELKAKSWKSFQFTTIEGGNVTEEEIEEARRDMSPKMFAQEYLASFECITNRVYENYDRKLNECELDENWGLADIHIGMDFNVNPMTAAISVFENNEVDFFDEIVEKNSNTQGICDSIKKRYPKATVFVYPDPTGNKRQTNAPVGQTDFDILRKNGFIVCTPPHPYPTKDKFNTCNAALCNAKGERRVRVAKGRCPHLKKAWEGYSYKDNGDTDKSTGLDHISDAAAYLICYKLPYSGQKKIRKPTVYGF